MYVFIFVFAQEKKPLSVMFGTSCLEWSKHLQRELSLVVDVSNALVDKFGASAVLAENQNVPYWSDFEEANK